MNARPRKQKVIVASVLSYVAFAFLPSFAYGVTLQPFATGPFDVAMIPDSADYDLRAILLASGELEIGEFRELFVQDFNRIALAAVELEAGPHEVTFGAWSSIGFFPGLGNELNGWAAIGSKVTIMPDAGEAVGDPVSMFLHIIPVLGGNGGTWTQKLRLTYIGESPFTSVLQDEVTFGAATDEVVPRTLSFTAKIGDLINMRARLTTQAKNNDTSVFFDLKYQLSLSPTPPPPPIFMPIPEPSGIAIATIGVLCLFAVGLRRRLRNPF